MARLLLRAALVVLAIAQASVASQNLPSHARGINADQAYIKRGRPLGHRSTNGTGEVLEDFQVASPVLTPEGPVSGNQILGPPPAGIKSSCQVLLMDHDFANSYGAPFVGNYTPPACSFNRVVINFTVVSEGVQYDRLALMYLGDNEVWRTSTAEPTAPPGIRWTYWTDLTSYLALWRQPQTVIFDLGNNVFDKYTGIYNCTLTATFYEDDLTGPAAPPADAVLPVSMRLGSSGQASAFTYPQANASAALTLPRNANRAVFSIAANGQADEEFWWSNVPQSGANVYGSASPLPGLSAFREIQLRIDGRLAGLTWPFPVVFTGGVSPPLHRPIVGLEAFDLREYEVDITPWLGYLSDGKQHTFSMDVYGVNDTGKTQFAQVPSNWVITGKVFLWLDPESHHTSGSAPEVTVSPLHFVVNEHIKQNVSLSYQQSVHRSIQVKARISTQHGSSDKAWTQQFDMTNDGIVNDQGDYSSVVAQYTGDDQASSDSSTYFYTGYSYPISSVSTYKQPDGSYVYSLTATLYQGLQRTVTGLTALSNRLAPFVKELPSNVAGSSLDTFRNSSAFYYVYDGGNKSGGYGSTHQVYKLGARNTGDPLGINNIGSPLLYLRDVDVVNDTIVADEEFTYNWPARPRPATPTHSQYGDYAPVPGKHGGSVLSIFSNPDGRIQGSLSLSERTRARRNFLQSDW